MTGDCRLGFTPDRGSCTRLSGRLLFWGVAALQQVVSACPGCPDASRRRADHTLPCPCGTELLLAPAKALVEGCKGVACGAEFTMWLTKAGRLLSAGCPQHGQLGHGTDHEYNAKDCARVRSHIAVPGVAQLDILAGCAATGSSRRVLACTGGISGAWVPCSTVPQALDECRALDQDQEVHMSVAGSSHCRPR